MQIRNLAKAGILLCGVQTSAALAAAPASVFEAMGITGTWAIACSQSASLQDPHITYSPQPDGTVMLRINTGSGEMTTTSVTAASSQPGNQLQTTSLTTFDNLPKPIRDSMTADNIRGDMTVRSTYSTETKGVLIPIDRFLKLSTDTNEIRVVANGFIMDPATHQPSERKMPPILKCSE